MTYLPFLQAAIAFTMGVVSLVVVYKLLNLYLKKTFGLTEVNNAYAIFQMGILISTALLVSSIIGPGLNAVRFINQNVVDFNTIMTSLGYVFVFLIIGILFSLLIVAGGVVVLFQLTHVNEWEEIKNNNLPTALISAALIFGLAIIMKDHVASVCEMLIPYPEVLEIR
jgi:uncharacterized membrane protein YjfL (UPF0719 family)